MGPGSIPGPEDKNLQAVWCGQKKKKKKKGKRKSDEGAVASDSIIGPWTLGFGHSPWVGGDNLVLYF